MQIRWDPDNTRGSDFMSHSSYLSLNNEKPERGCWGKKKKKKIQLQRAGGGWQHLTVILQKEEEKKKKNR